MPFSILEGTDLSGILLKTRIPFRSWKLFSSKESLGGWFVMLPGFYAIQSVRRWRTSGERQYLVKILSGIHFITAPLNLNYRQIV